MVVIMNGADKGCDNDGRDCNGGGLPRKVDVQ